MGIIWNTKDFQTKMMNINMRVNSSAGYIARDAAQNILSLARANAPRKTGALRTSGNITTLGGRSGFVEMQIEFSSYNRGFDYAEIQHERSDYRHPRGGRDHYLSIVIDTRGVVFVSEVMNGIQRVLA
jgi:hypothetical protein